MVTRKRINQYKAWFDNLSFFGYNSFVLDYIKDLYSLTGYVIYKYKDFMNNLNYAPNYTKISLNGAMNLVKKFYDKHNINLNIDELIKNNVLNLINSNKNKDDLLGVTTDGTIYKDSDFQSKIEIKLDGSIFDAFIIIHELSHYLNEPNERRNFVSDMLTEALAYSHELIFIEDIKDDKYHNDKITHLKGIMPLMYTYMYNLHDVYKLILLYKTKGNITKKLYSALYKDNCYEQVLCNFDKYASEKRSIINDTWFVIGLPLAIYNLEEYRKDKNFFDRLKKFNVDINEKNLWDCLKTININNKQEFKNKIKVSIETYVKVLNNMNNFKHE